MVNSPMLTEEEENAFFPQQQYAEEQADQQQYQQQHADQAGLGGNGAPASRCCIHTLTFSKQQLECSTCLHPSQLQQQQYHSHHLVATLTHLLHTLPLQQAFLQQATTPSPALHTPLCSRAPQLQIQQPQQQLLVHSPAHVQLQQRQQQQLVHFPRQQHSLAHSSQRQLPRCCLTLSSQMLHFRRHLLP
jgi:hypothetical protein